MTIGRSCNVRDAAIAVRFESTMQNMTRHRNTRSRIVPRLALAAAMLAALPAVAQELPRPQNHVADHANVIRDDVERKLVATLAELEEKTGAQILVVTVQTTGAAPIDDYTFKLAERWKLGQKGDDNGALVMVAVRDRKYWITVGYGLEPVLPDGLVGGVGRKYFVPYFRRSDYSSGIYAGTLALVQRVARENNVAVGGLPAAGPHAGGAEERVRTPLAALLGSCGIVPIIILIVVINALRARAGHHGRWGGQRSSNWLLWMVLGSMMSGGRRHHGGGSWGGGGFGGGFGGGSFGGGGGGGFGGGGAGGSW